MSKESAGEALEPVGLPLVGMPIALCPWRGDERPPYTQGARNQAPASTHHSVIVDITPSAA